MIVHVLNVKQQRILFKIIDGFGANAQCLGDLFEPVVLNDFGLFYL